MEIWKDIENYEGLYQVSNLGNVKSLNYNHTGKEHILKPHANSHGYLQVDLCKDGNQKTHQMHRLVASTFIENPDNLPQVNHKDERKTNNCVDNLEWVTAKENINHGTHNQRVAEALRGKPCPWVAEKRSIPVDMLTKSGELIRTFPSAHEAERYLRINGYPSASCCNINSCCKSRLQSCYGFKWRYAQGD